VAEKAEKAEKAEGAEMPSLKISSALKERQKDQSNLPLICLF
jgi:hypothetical protein